MWIKNKGVKLVFIIVIVVSVLFYLKNVDKVIKHVKKVSSNMKYYVGRDTYSWVLTNGNKSDVSERRMEKNIREILVSDKDKIIVIDPGHGGNDPGKVGVDNQLEKDINLRIAFFLKDKLVRNGFSVIMTRIDDVGLYNTYDKNKKVSDLRKRVEIVNTSEAICLVSVHQNSFASNKERGAQVFYYEDALLSKELAYNVQHNLKNYHDNYNTREIKGNRQYYILKNTLKPSIIVECGFLSNEEEGKLLLDEDYQESIARAISNGIISWANSIIDKKF